MRSAQILTQRKRGSEESPCQIPFQWFSIQESERRNTHDALPGTMIEKDIYRVSEDIPNPVQSSMCR
ncbi:hypothetical protein VTN31DRAFT_93 [Thermomyces dupontii]|uniref:uncharacterized protein n=1 Tax=Talaromyces thermophilus TaxID=28565 RepID=UPI003743A731